MSRIIGWSGRVLLVCSLAGWAAWWAVCNLYEFAPRLDALPLSVAALAGAIALAGGQRGAVAGWWLAALNALYLLAVHQGIGLADSGALWLPLASALVLGWAMKKRRALRPAV